MEVAKTRLQLDGELQGRAHLPASAKVAGAAAIPDVHPAAKAGPSGKVYTSAFDCMRKTWRHEGLGGIQRGLGAAVRLLRLASSLLQDQLTRVRTCSTRTRLR